MERAGPKYRLKKVFNKYLILEIMFNARFREDGVKFIHQVSKRYRQLHVENYKTAMAISEDKVSFSLRHSKDLECSFSKISFPKDKYCTVNFVLLSGEKLFCVIGRTLFVF
jgi:hypothetical protein